jgi:hypothetical protein
MAVYLKCVACGNVALYKIGVSGGAQCRCGRRGPFTLLDISRAPITRYDELCELAEMIWQKERAQRVSVEGVRR